MIHHACDGLGCRVLTACWGPFWSGFAPLLQLDVSTSANFALSHLIHPIRFPHPLVRSLLFSLFPLPDAAPRNQSTPRRRPNTHLPCPTCDLPPVASISSLSEANGRRCSLERERSLCAGAFPAAPGASCPVVNYRRMCAARYNTPRSTSVSGETQRYRRTETFRGP